MLQNIRETYINLLAKEMPRTLILSYVKKKGFKPPTERRQGMFSVTHMKFLQYYLFRLIHVFLSPN